MAGAIVHQHGRVETDHSSGGETSRPAVFLDLLIERCCDGVGARRSIPVRGRLPGELICGHRGDSRIDLVAGSVAELDLHELAQSSEHIGASRGAIQIESAGLENVAADRRLILQCVYVIVAERIGLAARLDPGTDSAGRALTLVPGRDADRDRAGKSLGTAYQGSAGRL